LFFGRARLRFVLAIAVFLLLVGFRRRFAAFFLVPRRLEDLAVVFFLEDVFFFEVFFLEVFFFVFLCGLNR